MSKQRKKKKRTKSESNFFRSKLSQQLIQDQLVAVTRKRKRRIRIREMTRASFFDWCRKHLKNVRLLFVLEQEDENDSWHQFS
jgi:hypothetical protein